jgi:tRNA A37 methylthiotransferase MiaB
MPNQVPVRVARERNRILRELGEQKKLSFMQSFVGKTIEAICLAREAENSTRQIYTETLTDNYLKLRLRGRHEPNRWVEARVEHVEDGALLATLTATLLSMQNRA